MNKDVDLNQRVIRLENDGLDGIRLTAVMLAPEDAKFRSVFSAANFVRAREWDLPGPPVLVERDLLAGLLDAPSWDSLVTIVGERTKAGIVAGYALIAMFMMWRFPELHGGRTSGGVSLNKAFHVCDYLARQLDWKYGDGEQLPLDTKAAACWRKYRSVAHLWAAEQWHQAFPLGPGKLLHGDQLPALLSAARYFQLFGLETRLQKKSVKSAEAILSADHWSIPNSVRALLPLDDDVSRYADSPIAQALRNYAAK